jgi:lipopolysaccharide export system ATP-binding protein
MSDLIIKDIVCNYKKRVIINNISLSVRAGEIIGLLGPNGSGKTTIFYNIMGLQHPDSGKITVSGKDISRKPLYLRSKYGISYLPQESSLFPDLTVEKNILIALELLKISKEDREAKLQQLLTEFSIEKLRSSLAISLSGGERRRVEIARSIACNPKFVLFDEPFAGVDPLAIGEISDLIKRLKDRGIAVLLTDHNVSNTLKIVDRAYIIFDGKLLTHGVPDEIVANKDVKKYYLGKSFKI